MLLFRNSHRDSEFFFFSPYFLHFAPHGQLGTSFRFFFFPIFFLGFFPFEHLLSLSSLPPPFFPFFLVFFHDSGRDANLYFFLASIFLLPTVLPTYYHSPLALIIIIIVVVVVVVIIITICLFVNLMFRLC